MHFLRLFFCENSYTMAPLLGRVSSGISRCFFQYSSHKLTTRYKCRTFDRYLNVSAARLVARKYSEKHEWITVENKIATLGITHYAQDALGEVVYVQLPDVGATYEKDSEIGVVESVKAVNEIYTPVSGKVTEVNELLSDEPGAINESCYDKGWICKMDLLSPEQLNDLMDEEQYEKYLKSIE